MERFVYRDTVLRSFVANWTTNVAVSPDLQQEFLGYFGQIVARKCLRMGMRGEGLVDTLDKVRLEFITAVDKGNYMMTEAPVASYLSTLTRNSILNEQKKRRAANNWIGKQEQEMVLPKSERPVEEEVDSREGIRIICKIVEDLPEKQKEPIVLLAQGFTHEEICETLGISDRALESRLYRARQTLSTKLPGSTLED
jgi:RNA polymerase sigma-70 factor (ECF subfamily)